MDEDRTAAVALTQTLTQTLTLTRALILTLTQTLSLTLTQTLTLCAGGSVVAPEGALAHECGPHGSRGPGRHEDEEIGAQLGRAASSEGPKPNPNGNPHTLTHTHT